MERAVVCSDVLDHLAVELAGIKPKDLGLAWKKDPEVSRYKLVGSPALASGQVTFVFKGVAKDWGVCTGNSAASLKAAQADAELHLRNKLMSEILGFQSFLVACASPAGASEPDQCSQFEITYHGYRALELALTGFFKSRVTQAVKQFPDIRARRTLSVLASAFAGYDIGDLKLMFTPPSIHFSSGMAGLRFLSPEAIRFRISTLDNDSEVLRDHSMFKDFPELQLTSLDQESMARSIDEWIYLALELANVKI